MSKFESIFKDYEKALTRLDDVLKQEKNEFMRDSAIQRFEVAFELAWKSAKAFIQEKHNVRCVSPQNCFKECFRLGLIDYDESWLSMSYDRNMTVYTYNEEKAEEIYKKLPKYLELLKSLAVSLSKEEA